MKKEGIKGSVVAAALVLGLVTAPTSAKAGWLSDTWDSFTDTVGNLFEDNTQDTVGDLIDEVVLQPVEDGIIYLIENGGGKSADYLIGLILQLDGFDGQVVFDLMIELMQNKDIITDDILMAMFYNEDMVSLIEKTINAAETEEERRQRAEKFFNVALGRIMPPLVSGEVTLEVDKIPSKAFVMFSNLGSVEDTNDGLEKAWENVLKQSMSSTQSANALFGILNTLTPEQKKAMLDFMFFAKTADGQYHTAESVNFNQSMIEGFSTLMQNDQDAAMTLFRELMPMLATFDTNGNMIGMTPSGMRFFTVLGTKAMTCGDESAMALLQGLSTMMPPNVVLPVITNTEACGRVEDPAAIALLNSEQFTYVDTDHDGVPDFMDRYPGVDNSQDADGDGIPDGSDDDIDGDGIPNASDADMNGDGIVDNGPDMDGNGIKDNYDTDTDNDGIADHSDDDIDGDGIPNDMDADVDGDGVVDNGADTDGDGINDAHDNDIDGDGIANDMDADADGNGIIDDGKSDTDGDGIDNTSDNDVDGDGIDNNTDDDIDGDGIGNDEDADVNGDGTVDNGADTDGDGVNDEHDNDIDGDGISNDNDADADGDENVDDGKSDTDGDGITDNADADADGDGHTDDGAQDDDNDGINDDVEQDNGRVVETIVYFYGADGVLRDRNFQEVINRDYSNEADHITNVTIMMPGNKSVVIEVDMDGIQTDDKGNKMIISDVLDDKGNRFIISMTTDGFGKVFIGNADGGFEMSGYLHGMKENEELVFSVSKTQDGKLAGKTTIMPKDKKLAFGSSVFNQ